MAEVSEPGLLLTLRWRGMDSNFQYAGAVNLIVASLFSPRAFHRAHTAAGWTSGGGPCSRSLFGRRLIG